MTSGVQACSNDQGTQFTAWDLRLRAQFGLGLKVEGPKILTLYLALFGESWALQENPTDILGPQGQGLCRLYRACLFRCYIDSPGFSSYFKH